MKAYVFPGQGAQFSGMGKELYDHSDKARELFETANEILGFRITDVMFGGTNDDLKQTNVTQPAIFLHSVIAALTSQDFRPDMVAGHSVGEFSALTAAGTLSFEDGLQLTAKRADAMQKACEANPSGMAAILGLEDNVVEEICESISELVVPANYNCPGQLVISGSNEGVKTACEKATEAGAKRALPLKVAGAFHSPFMASAGEELEKAVRSTFFNAPSCKVYQNTDGKPSTDIEEIKEKLIKQLTAPVKWTQTVRNMIADGATVFIECGPGKVLQGLVRKINTEVEHAGLS